MKKRIYFQIVALLCATKVLANETTSVQTLDNSNFSLSAGVNYNSNFYKPSSPEHFSTLEPRLIPSYKISENLSLSTIFWGEKELNDKREFNLYDSYVSFQHRFYKNEFFSLTQELRGYIPLSEDSLKNRHLQTSAYYALSLDTSWKSLKIGYKPSLKRNFHQFQTTMTGSSNTQWTLSHNFVARYALTEKLSLSSINYYIQHRTYVGNTKDFFWFIAESDYQVNEKLNLSIGYSNYDSPLNADGRSNVVRLINQQNATFYTGATYRF